MTFKLVHSGLTQDERRKKAQFTWKNLLIHYLIRWHLSDGFVNFVEGRSCCLSRDVYFPLEVLG